MKQKKFRSFSKRLSRWIAFTQLIVMVLASYWIFMFVKNFVLMEEASLYKSSLSTVNAKVGQIVQEVSTAATNRTGQISATLDQPDQLLAVVAEVVSQNPAIRSCGLSFVDSYYPQKGRWYCPYAVRDGNGKIATRVVGDASHDYLKSEWFTEALRADSGYWSKPFFDASDSITSLVSYLLPVRDRQGRTVAILGADLSLNQISKSLFGAMFAENDTINLRFGSDGQRGQDLSDNGFVNFDWRSLSKKFIIDHDGTFVAHPDRNFIIRENYFALAKTTNDTIDDHVGHQMVAGHMGSYSQKNGLLVQSFRSFDSDIWSVYIFYEPVKNTSWSIASIVPSVMMDSIAIGLGVIMVVLIAIALLVTRIAGHIIIKRATKPLSQLATSAKEVAGGNFNASLPQLKHNDEIRLLRDAFEDMQHSLSQYVAELKQTTASKAAIENELRIAHDIQMSMLPKTFPPYPERSDIDIYGTLTPAKDVGGDLFDFYIHDERLYFCIGDVSGKGVPASLLMAVTRSLFRNVSTHLSSPSHIVMALNSALCEGNDSNMFVTFFAGVLDLGSGHLTYCNAAHNAPLLLGSNHCSELPCDPNLPLGVMAGWEYTLQEMTLQPRSAVFLYTDGLNEAENASHQQFQMERVVGVIDRLLADGQPQSETMVSQMAGAVHHFVGTAEQSDDLTMLAVRYLP